MRTLIAILVALACVEGSAGTVSRQAASPSAPAGFVVYCLNPSQGENLNTEPVPMLRTVPSGKAVPLFRGSTLPPFHGTTVLSIDPTGRYVALEGISEEGFLPPRKPDLPPPPFWLWILDLKTGRLIPLPGRTSERPTEDHPGYFWSDWCSDGSVLAVNINDSKGNRIDLWDMRTGRIRTAATNRPPPYEGHVWLCVKGTFLDASWDVGRTNRLMVHATGRENWKASWPLKPHPYDEQNFADMMHLYGIGGEGLYDFASTSDGQRFAATTGSLVVIAERGKKLHKLPTPNIRDLKWSHDGRKLVGTSVVLYNKAVDSYGFDIGLISPVSGHFQPLTGWGNIDWDHNERRVLDNEEHVLAWSNDDRSLIGWTGLTGYPSYPKLWSLDISTKKKTVLWDSKDVVTSFAWHERPPPAPLP